MPHRTILVRVVSLLVYYSFPRIIYLTSRYFVRTSQPHIHYLVSIFAGVPFGIGVAQILQGLTAYVMDAYGLYFASAIAATVVLRSIGGAIFPLFSTSMFNALGDQWAMSVFGFMSAVCMPMPIIFFVSPLLPSNLLFGIYGVTARIELTTAHRNTAGGSAASQSLRIIIQSRAAISPQDQKRLRATRKRRTRL